LPDVLPSLEPMPRPTRTFLCRDPRAGLKLDRFTAMLSSICCRFFHNHQMPDLQDHPANSRNVGVLNDLIHTAKAKPSDGLPHVPRAGNETSHPLDF
jgi:hypothetical protein